MELTGEKVINGTRAEVYDALHDPAVLRQAIPGCQSIIYLGDGRYEAAARLKVGPVRAKFTGTVELEKDDRPSGYSIKGSVDGGAAGGADGEAHVALATISMSTTNIAYHVSVEPHGDLGTIEETVLTAAGRTLITEFFSRLALIIETGTAPLAEPPRARTEEKVPEVGPEMAAPVPAPPAPPPEPSGSEEFDASAEKVSEPGGGNAAAAKRRVPREAPKPKPYTPPVSPPTPPQEQPVWAVRSSAPRRAPANDTTTQPVAPPAPPPPPPPVATAPPPEPLPPPLPPRLKAAPARTADLDDAQVESAHRQIGKVEPVSGHATGDQVNGGKTRISPVAIVLALVGIAIIAMLLAESF